MSLDASGTELTELEVCPPLLDEGQFFAAMTFVGTRILTAAAGNGIVSARVDWLDPCTCTLTEAVGQMQLVSAFALEPGSDSVQAVHGPSGSRYAIDVSEDPPVVSTRGQRDLDEHVGFTIAPDGEWLVGAGSLFRYDDPDGGEDLVIPVGFSGGTPALEYDPASDRLWVCADGLIGTLDRNSNMTPLVIENQFPRDVDCSSFALAPPRFSCGG